MYNVISPSPHPTHSAGITTICFWIIRFSRFFYLLNFLYITPVLLFRFRLCIVCTIVSDYTLKHAYVPCLCILHHRGGICTLKRGMYCYLNYLMSS